MFGYFSTDAIFNWFAKLNIFHINQSEMTFWSDKLSNRSSQSRHPLVTSFPPGLLREWWRSKSTNFNSNRRSGEFLVTFFGKKWLAWPAMRSESQKRKCLDFLLFYKNFNNHPFKTIFNAKDLPFKIHLFRQQLSQNIWNSFN